MRENDSDGPPDHRQREDGVQQPVQSQSICQPADDPLLGQDQLPGIDPHQIAGPERQHDADVEQGPGLAAGVARHVVGHWKAEQGTGQGHQQRHADGAQDHVQVLRPQQGDEVLQAQFVADLAAELVQPEEGVGEQHQQGADIDDAEPQQGRPEQDGQQQTRPPVEQGGEAPQRPIGEGGSGLAHGKARTVGGAHG